MYSDWPGGWSIYFSTMDKSFTAQGCHISQIIKLTSIWIHAKTVTSYQSMQIWRQFQVVLLYQEKNVNKLSS